MNQVAAPFAAATSGGFTFSPSATPAPGAQSYNNTNNNSNNNNNNNNNLHSYSTPPPPGHQPKPQQLSLSHQHQQQSQHSQPFTSHASAPGFSQQHPALSPQIYGTDASMMGGASMSPQHQQADAAHMFQHPQQRPQQFAGQQPFMPYTAAPYQAATPVAQTATAQNIRQSQSISPHHSLSPPASGASAHQQPPLPPPQQQPTPPNKFPMAAPPLPHTPANAPSSSGAQAVQSPRTPQSPATQSREHQRVALLLDINVELLQEVNRLQGEGKGGALSPQQQAQFKSQGLPDTIASDEYIQCLRRVQANLSYMGNMAPRSQPDASKILPGPAFMTPPPHMSQLASRYEQLRDLFPGWPGHIQKSVQPSSNSPNPNGMNASSPMS